MKLVAYRFLFLLAEKALSGEFIISYIEITYKSLEFSQEFFMYGMEGDCHK